MNYFVNGMSWRHTEHFPIDLTDFSDFSSCFRVLEDTLKLRSKAFLALRFVLEKDNPDEDEAIVIRYQYVSGKLSIVLINEEEYVINEGIPLFVSSSRKISGLLDKLDSDEYVEEIVKIIEDYGIYIALGVQWAAFLLKELENGTLEQYFDDLTALEIH